MKHIISTLIIAFLLISCHKIHDGKVVSKRIVPAHSYNYTTFMPCGKYMMPIVHKGYAESKYVLTIEKDSITEDFSVSEETYKCKELSDMFNDSIPCERYEFK